VGYLFGRQTVREDLDSRLGAGCPDLANGLGNPSPFVSV